MKIKIDQSDSNYNIVREIGFTYGNGYISIDRIRIYNDGKIYFDTFRGGKFYRQKTLKDERTISKYTLELKRGKVQDLNRKDHYFVKESFKCPDSQYGHYHGTTLYLNGDLLSFKPFNLEHIKDDNKQATVFNELYSIMLDNKEVIISNYKEWKKLKPFGKQVRDIYFRLREIWNSHTVDRVYLSDIETLLNVFDVKMQPGIKKGLPYYKQKVEGYKDQYLTNHYHKPYNQDQIDYSEKLLSWLIKEGYNNYIPPLDLLSYISDKVKINSSWETFDKKLKGKLEEIKDFLKSQENTIQKYY